MRMELFYQKFVSFVRWWPKMISFGYIYRQRANTPFSIYFIISIVSLYYQKIGIFFLYLVMSSTKKIETLARTQATCVITILFFFVFFLKFYFGGRKCVNNHWPIYLYLYMAVNFPSKKKIIQKRSKYHT